MELPKSGEVESSSIENVSSLLFIDGSMDELCSPPKPFEFAYADADRLDLELTDIYCFGEWERISVDASACFSNRQSRLFPEQPPQQQWTLLSQHQKLQMLKDLVVSLCDDEDQYDNVCVLLFLLQGGHSKGSVSVEQIRSNVMLLIEQGILSALTELMNRISCKITHNNVNQDTVNIGDIAIAFHTIIEIIRSDHERRNELVQTYLSDGQKRSLPSLTLKLATNLISSKSYRIASKLLTLTWKLILLLIGDMNDLMNDRIAVRCALNLPGPPNHQHPENSLEIANNLSDCLDLMDASPSGDDLCIAVESRRLKRKQFKDSITSELTIKEIGSNKPSNYSFPWRAKCSKKSIVDYLNENRKKQFGFTFENDHTSVVGLPESIKRSHRIMSSFLYVPLSHHQITAFENEQNYPITHSQTSPTTRFERFYQEILMLLPFHVKQLCDLFAFYAIGQTTYSILNKSVLGVEKHTTTEALTSLKSITAFFLLLLKHLKLNHIMQFEFVCQKLVNDGLPEKICAFFIKEGFFYAESAGTSARPRNLISPPNDSNRPQPTDRSWAFIFVLVNLLRISNKLSKNSHTRSSRMFSPELMKSLRLMFTKNEMLVDEHLTLTPSISYRNCPLVQYYNIKLVKIMSAYCSRQWRKVNMYRFPVIYYLIRHRFNDDWACAMTAGTPIDPEVGVVENEIRLMDQAYEFHRKHYFAQTQIHFASHPNADLSISWLKSDDQDHLNEDQERCLDHDNLPTWFLDNVDHWVARELDDSKIDWDKVLLEIAAVID